MPVNGERFIDGLTHQQAFDGLNIGEIPGDSGLGPFVMVIFWGAENMPPNNPSISLIGLPSNAGASGTDSNGVIVATKTFVNSGDDKLYDLTGGGTVLFQNGFWQSMLRTDVNSALGTRYFYIQIQTLLPGDPTDFPGVPPPPTKPNKPTVAGTVPPAEGLNVTWTSGSPLPTDDIGYLIERSTDGVNYTSVGSVPKNTTTFPTHTFNDLNTIPVFPVRYKIRTYRYGPNAITIPSDPSDPYSPAVPPNPNYPEPPAPPAYQGVYIPCPGDNSPNPTPTIVDITGGITLGGAPSIVLMKDPSGIYTLVKGKTKDTLYERITGVASVDVKIPDPFIKTGFVGE